MAEAGADRDDVRVTIAIHELVSRYGEAVDRHVAAVFVGAGLSMQAGLPSWSTLIQPLADEIGVDTSTDLTLIAEYFERTVPGGRERLAAHLATELSSIRTPHEGQQLVAQLGVTEIWTTNFDPLLELARPDAIVVNIDDEAPAVGSGEPVVIKMHGGFSFDGSTPRWRGTPVITRGDFERYDVEHPRLWALLHASYLTRTMLFLGFSFTDPNIELLLRLARRQGTAAGNHHLAVLRRPTKPNELALHELRVLDLEGNGVQVCEINEFDQLVPLLRSIKRRTKPSCMFVSGSGENDLVTEWSDRVGTLVASHPTWQVASLGGDAGWLTTRRVGLQRRSAGTYIAEDLKLYFRRREGEPPPPLSERIGTAVFSDSDRHPLVDEVIESCRAMVVVGGGDRATEEINLALNAGLGVVPIAASGGAAHDAWQAATTPGSDPRRLLLGGRPADPAMWAQLDDADHYVAQQAAATLLEQAMY